MLKGIPEILSPQLLKVLCEMGHSDRIVIADGNFPVESMGKNAVVVRCDGHGVPELLDAILTVIPLDSYVEKPVTLMEVMPGDPVKTPIWDTYKEIVSKHDDRGADAVGNIERLHSTKKPRKHTASSLQVRRQFTQMLCFRRVLLSTINSRLYEKIQPCCCFITASYQKSSAVFIPAELLFCILIYLIIVFFVSLKEPDHNYNSDNDYND